MKKSYQIFVVLLLAVFCFALFPRSASAEDSEKVLRVYNWGEYISNGDDGSLNTIKEFEARNPGVKVEYTTFATNEEMYAKIASGSANYDILIPSDYMIGRMIEEGMLAKLDFDNIPNYSKIDEGFRGLEFDPNNEYSVPYTWGTVGIVYNKTKVTGPITSWDVLWDEQYTGQVLMFDNPRDAYGIAMKKLGYSQNTTEKSRIDEATQLLKDQKSVVQSYVMDQIFSKMPNGEAALAPYYAGDAITMIEENPDLDFVVPEEGSNTFVDSMVIPSTSQNKELAERFINFMLEDDIAQANIEFIGYSTPMSSVRELLDEELKDSPISYPSQEILDRCDTFTHLDPETTAYMQEGWIEILSYGETSGTPFLLAIVVIVAVILAVLFILKKRKNRY